MKPAAPSKSKGESTPQGIGELSWASASRLLNENRFVTLQDRRSPEILRYEGGVYVGGGEAFIERKIQSNFASKSQVSTHLINETLAHVSRSTLQPRSIFEENNPHLVLENCLLNLETMQPEEHTPDYYALNKLHVTHDPKASCENFLTFIKEILPSEDVLGVQEEWGAILRKKYLTKKLSIYLGETDTGKTTLINVLLKLLGQENVSSVSIQELASYNVFVLAQLYGKMANIRDDVSKDIVSSVGKLKELTGGFQVSAQKKFHDPFNFTNSAYLIFTCNELPPIEEDDRAFFNRVIIRAFNRKFGGKAAPDRELITRLTTTEELSGILNWALDGLKRLKGNGWNFTNTATLDATRESYKKKSDPVWAFTNDCIEEASADAIAKERLYNAFKEYCRLEDVPLMSRDRFFKGFPEKIHVESGHRELVKGEGKKHCFVGIQFKQGKQKLGLNDKNPVLVVPPVPGQSQLGNVEQPEQAEQGSANLGPNDKSKESLVA